MYVVVLVFFFFQAEDGIRDLVRSRGLGDVYKRQAHRSLVDAHVCVDPRISVSEGHHIAELTRKRILLSLIHI